MSCKKLVLELCSKNLQTNQNTDFCILQYEVNFLFVVTIRKSNKFVTSFQVDAVSYAQTCPKLSQIVSQFHLKNELSKNVSFWHVVRSSQKSKITSVISSGCGQTCSKCLRITSQLSLKMNSGMNMIFYICLGIHNYIYMIQSIHMRVVRYIWASQKFVPILIMHYVKTELNCDADFLHMARYSQKLIQIDPVISSSLTV